MKTLSKNLCRISLVAPALAAALVMVSCSGGLQSDLREGVAVSGGPSGSRSSADSEKADGSVPQSVSGTNFTRLLSFNQADFECDLAGVDGQVCRAVNRFDGGVIERDLTGFSDVRSVTWYVGQEQHGGSACESIRNGLELRCALSTIPEQTRVRLVVINLVGTRRTIGTNTTPQTVADLGKVIDDGRGYVLFLAGPASGSAMNGADTREMLNQACRDAGDQLIKAGPLAKAHVNRYKALVGGKDDKIMGLKSDLPVMTVTSPMADGGLSASLIPVASSLKNFWSPKAGFVLDNAVQSLADGTPAPSGSVVWTGKSVQADGSVKAGSSCGGWNLSGRSGFSSDDDDTGSSGKTFGSVGEIGGIAGARWLSSGMVQECSTSQAMVYCVAYHEIVLSNLANNDR